MAIKKITVPHLGDFSDIPVIEVYIKEGDSVAVDDSLIALESAKAVTDIPSPYAGTIVKVLIKEGDLVNEGTAIAEIEVAEEAEKPKAKGEPAPEPKKEVRAEAVKTEVAEKEAEPSPPASPPSAPKVEAAPLSPPPLGGAYHATPALRRYARELGVDLSRVTGSGAHGRILHEDVQRLVKEAISGRGTGATPSALEDFSVYGAIERIPLTRIQKFSGPHLADSWRAIPHVTQFDEADVTELEAFRRSVKSEIKLSILPFVIKALSYALKEYPTLNASFDEAHGEIILKRYHHIGVAVDTAEGLVVPVVRNVEEKSITEIAAELIALSQRARERKLKSEDLAGGSFSVSSLGGIGGTYFTPIINRPEVAILGLSRIKKQPVWDGEVFAARDILPLSLSYDHRVVDGATAVRFTSHLATLLNDLRRVLL
jgi:pyruvate dehydrogenase E2 component (dihydrolipoamide acetyltransferase)